MGVHVGGRYARSDLQEDMVATMSLLLPEAYTVATGRSILPEEGDRLVFGCSCRRSLRSLRPTRGYGCDHEFAPTRRVYGRDREFVPTRRGETDWCLGVHVGGRFARSDLQEDMVATMSSLLPEAYTVATGRSILPEEGDRLVFGCSCRRSLRSLRPTRGYGCDHEFAPTRRVNNEDYTVATGRSILPEEGGRMAFGGSCRRSLRSLRPTILIVKTCIKRL